MNHALGVIAEIRWARVQIILGNCTWNCQAADYFVVGHPDMVLSPLQLNHHSVDQNKNQSDLEIARTVLLAVLGVVVCAGWCSWGN